MKKEYIKLEDLEVYQISFKLGKKTFELVQEFPKQNRFHEGDQFLRAIDSIAANIAEGYGRFHYMDKVRFYLNARGSLYESTHWIKVASYRKLINEQQEHELTETINILSLKLNNLIKATRENNSKNLNN